MAEKTILIVEDEETNSLYLESLLSINKFKYLLAIDGQQAIDIVNNNKVDLILMDIKLPRLNGLEATEIIKKSHPDIPDDYVSKPIEKDCLLLKINKLIK